MLKVLSSKISWPARVPLWIGAAVFAACAAALFYMALLYMFLWIGGAVFAACAAVLLYMGWLYLLVFTIINRFEMRASPESQQRAQEIEQENRALSGKLVIGTSAFATAPAR
jgi:ABC-type protease/lipase transport system fused ATPase/permease subunit